MTRSRELTGRHVAVLFVSAFGVIIGVNLLLAYKAVQTFPGLEVANSYVASQTFDAERSAQMALGWTVNAEATHETVRLRITDAAGSPVEAAQLDATVGRATSTRQDQTPDFVFDGEAYVATLPLGPGNWNLRMKAIAADGTPFHQRVVLHVGTSGT